MSGEYAYLISAVYSVRTQEIETLLQKKLPVFLLKAHKHCSIGNSVNMCKMETISFSVLWLMENSL